MKRIAGVACLILSLLSFSASNSANSTAQRSQPARPSGEKAHIPSPGEVLGFTPGDDRKLTSWNQVLDYFDKLDQASDRVKFEALGKSTKDVPFVMATISAPENLARLEDYKRIQDQLADPRKLGAMRNRDRKAAPLIARGKTIVLITCGIHSTEVGSYLSSMLIAYRLASSDEPQIQNILQNTIVLLVPSLNPDGVDIVKNWYDKTLGTPYEGTSPPELYHKYVGHDNNRDWYAFTQVETQITVSKIHNVWHPQIVHDIHQQGEFGSRLFLPPYMQPVEPNVPKQIVEGYTQLGNWMAQELRADGFQGITTNSTYDAWTPARAYSHYHGGVRILSETASAKIATPTTIKFEQLRSREGYDPQKESANFGPVWKGGEWHLRDITNYMTAAAFKLLEHAATNREQWLGRFYEIGKEAVRPRKNGELGGYLIKGGDSRTHNNRMELIDLLLQADVEVQPLKSGGGLRGRQYSQGSFFVPMAQPEGAFAKALLEEQHYPDLRDRSGHPIAPYDVTAHTLPLLMGVQVERIIEPVHFQYGQFFSTARTAIARMPFPGVRLYKSNAPAMDEGWTRWVFEQELQMHGESDWLSIDDEKIRQGIDKVSTIIIPDQPPRTILNGYAKGTMPEELTGGLGQEGVKALREFVDKGGTLVFLNRAAEFAIEQFKLPIRNVVTGVPRTEFYVPGSILRLELDTSHPIARGMPKETIAWAENSPVFEVVDNAANVRVIGWYPKDKNPLLSGWLLGGERIKGKAALVEVKMGNGRIVLFGFRPQYRGQSSATYPLLFNSLN
jgi:hypothetical protein